VKLWSGGLPGSRVDLIRERFLPLHIVVLKYFPHYTLRIGLHRSPLVAWVLLCQKLSGLSNPFNEPFAAFDRRFKNSMTKFSIRIPAAAGTPDLPTG